MDLGADAARNAVQEGSDFTLYVCRGSQVEKEAIFLFYEPASCPSLLGAIHWCSRGTREVIPENCLQLNQLTDILITKQTAVFQSPEASEAVDNHCFSVLTKDNALDLEAASRQLLETWTFGIETLMASRCVTKVKHGENDLVSLPRLCTPSKPPVSAHLSTPVPALSTPVPTLLSTPGPLHAPPLVPVDAIMPPAASSSPVSVPVASPASLPIIASTPTSTTVPTGATLDSPKDEDPFSTDAELKPSTYVMATPMRIPGAPSPLNNLRIRSHLRPTLGQARDSSLLGEFRSADEVFKSGTESEATEGQQRPRESVTRLSMVNFLALKERRVQELQTKIERLTGSLNSPVPKQLLSARPGSRAQQRAGGMHMTTKELKELISDMKRDTEFDLKSMQEHMEYSVMAMSTAFNIQKKRNAQLEENLRQETKRRKAAVEKVLDLQGSIRVFCRVRPLMPKELSEGDHAIVKVDQEDSLVMAAGETKRFNYDHVFGPQSTQEQVFMEVSPLVDSCISGYTVCIFAYGQTGSGKTHTMEGSKNDRGVNYRALQYLFESCAEEQQQNPALSHQVNVSVVEIYMEEVRDLLSVHGPGVRMEIREGADGVYIPGLEERVVTSVEQVQDLMLHEAYPNRQVRGTSMNDKSSRSHCLVFVRCAVTNASTGVKTLGTLILIDLAGSERLKKSEAVGDAMKEAQAINKSLAALGNVIAALQQRNAHVPYRDSKLTFLLQNSLGGSCKCLMFCQIGPAASNHQETSCSLTFANRVRSTKLGQAKKNVSETRVSEPRSPISNKLKDQMKTMEQTLKAKTDGMMALEMRIRELEQENVALREAGPVEREAGHMERPKEKSRSERILQPTRTNEVRREAFISSIHSETTRLDTKKKAAPPVTVTRTTRSTLKEAKSTLTKKEPTSPAKDASPLTRKRKGDEAENKDKENEVEVNRAPKPASRSKSLSHVHKKPKQRAKKAAAATLVPGTMGRSKRFAF